MKKSFYVIRSRDRGLFSNFLHTIQYLFKADARGKIPIVHWNIIWYMNEGSEDNVWEYYFCPVSDYSLEDIDPNDGVKNLYSYRNGGVSHYLEGEKNGGRWDRNSWNYKVHPPKLCIWNPNKKFRAYYNKVISKHIRIKKQILDKIDRFYKENMEDCENVLGAHIRACSDRDGGSRDIDIKGYTDSIDKYISEFSDAKIFVATDYNPVLEELVSKYGDRVVYYDSQRSDNGYSVIADCSPVEEKKNRGSKPGEEVVIDCLLLSKCNKIIHKSSNVSTAALLFNPDNDNEYIF